MKMNLLRKTALCLLAGAFLAGSVYASTTGSNTAGKKSTAVKPTTKKNDLFGADNKDTKKEKTTPTGIISYSRT